MVDGLCNSSRPGIVDLISVFEHPCHVQMCPWRHPQSDKCDVSAVAASVAHERVAGDPAVANGDAGLRFSDSQMIKVDSGIENGDADPLVGLFLSIFVISWTLEVQKKKTYRKLLEF